MSPARAIAEDHCDWCAESRVTPADVCLSVGTLPCAGVTWEDACLAVALAWTELAKTDRRAAA